MLICDFCKDVERAKNGMVVKQRELRMGVDHSESYHACDECWEQVTAKAILHVRKMQSGEIPIIPNRRVQ